VSVRVTSWVWQHSPVDHRGDLLVMLVLADHAHDDGTVAYTIAMPEFRAPATGGAITAPPVKSLHPGEVTAPVKSAARGGEVSDTQTVLNLDFRCVHSTLLFASRFMRPGSCS